LRTARIDLELVERRFDDVATPSPGGIPMELAAELLRYQRLHPQIVQACRSRAVGTPGTLLHTRTLVEAIRRELSLKEAAS